MVQEFIEQKEAIEQLPTKGEEALFFDSLRELPLLSLGRNDFCLCGSGKKYKKCHGA